MPIRLSHGSLKSSTLTWQSALHKISPAAEKKLVRMVKSQAKNPTKKQVCNELEAAGRQVSVSAVKCVLHQLELRGCRASEKPLAPDVEP